MKAWAGHPVIYEINTAVWLDELSRKAGERVTLASVPPAEWDAATPAGVDAVWLMGVWERSPAGLAVATGNQELQSSFREALPDVQAADIIGSPYCVRRYVVDGAFGGPTGLSQARAALATIGIGLILDYVPNHVAPDHPWTWDHPERFIRGYQSDLDTDPAAWTKAGEHVLARGRDPYFPPWPDVVQLNAFSHDLRQATIQTLGDISDQCDGIRCDMAMLMTNEVFARTWGDRSGPAPVQEFWPEIIGELRKHHPATLLLAEAYWDLEWELQQQGFDFCYDKRLYDRILEGDAGAVRAHLGADLAYQSRLVRFLENHDEPRVASRLGPQPERAAAVAIATLPGATLWHEGQFEGRRVRPPVFLARRPDEAPDHDLGEWYRTLIAAVAEDGMRQGTWRMLEVRGWPDNQTGDNLLAWAWADDADRRAVVVINLSDGPAQARIPLGFGDLAGRQMEFRELLDGTSIWRDPGEVTDPGLFVDLGPWRYHLLTLAGTGE
jgi:hypothetical protein